MSEDKLSDLEQQKFEAAIDKWLDRKFAEFGRWSFFAVLAIFFTTLVILSLRVDGWHK